MWQWMRARMGENTTHAGLAAIAGGVATMLPTGSGWQMIAGGAALLLGGKAAVSADKVR